jgi:hypothetical protein
MLPPGYWLGQNRVPRYHSTGVPAVQVNALEDQGHTFCIRYGFWHNRFCHSEAIVLWLDRDTLPLVSASFSLALIPFLCPYCLYPFHKPITIHLCFETGL